MNQFPQHHLAPRRDFCLSMLAAAGAVGSGLLPALLLAQPPATRPPAAKTPPKVKPAQAVNLETKDGVALRAVYFPGNRGKETVPIILLHGWEERGAVWEPLAKYLQASFGHAVMVPDLRGHGQSVTQNVPGAVEARTLEPDKLLPTDLEAMIWDVQACKKYLQEENNKGELNLEMLCVMGAEYGALVAMQFAALDWSWPQLTTGKQGQDVKAVALLTPIDKFKRLTAAPAVMSLRNPAASRSFSLLLIAGKQDRTSYSDAKRLHRQFEAMFPKSEEPTEQALWFIEPDTNSHGAQLIDPARSLGLERAISDFVLQRVVARKDDFAWTERKSALTQK